ncbi:ABC transporter permease [Candidatus Izimaplasma bacterium ZiA1]|uniref:sugar ABC transporter permease n=1 Tax=Candidatus Izimoplasma sp. ZiA1 TaxID=2024899 RepID=UPI000BAA4E97|nr:ABC transporter permease [Candidatus Izimaplasma bacterium ZiA1]
MNIIKNYGKDLFSILKENVREYGMYIALLLIITYFTIASGGIFISARNISNLLNQTGYIFILAVGMTLIIVIRHIDLSVGYIAGFLGALAAIFMTQHNIPVLITIIIVLIIGLIIGLWNGFLVAYMGLPAFVATLAGMLIFRGALLLSTRATGTITISNEAFNAISNGYIPDVANIEGVHLLTLIIGLLSVLIYVFSEMRKRKTLIKYKFEVMKKDMFITKLIFISLIISLFFYTLSQYRGISWTVVIIFIVVAIYSFITNKTVLGRHIYAVGGNPEAAELSGISVKKITLTVFGSMSMLAALSGILFASRLQSATTTAGQLFELDAIAAAFVGGVSASGGIGKVTGSIIGALVMASLSSGMNLLGVDVSIQYIIKGLVLVAAVVFDVRTRNKK